jgi:integrase/recombinase XerD
MSELKDRMIQDLKLAGLDKTGTDKVYLRSVRQLSGYYMLPPDRLTEGQVQDYILYVRDELGVARGTFEPMFFGLKFFYVNTLGYEWALFTKKKSASHARNGCPTSAAMTIAGA